MRVVFPPPPVLSPEETEWVASGAFPLSPALPTLDDVERANYAGDRARLPWSCPVWDAGVDVVDFVPGLPSQKLPFWEKFILCEHSNRDQFLPFLRDGVELYNRLLMQFPAFRSVSRSTPAASGGRFSGTVSRRSSPTL